MRKVTLFFLFLISQFLSFSQSKEVNIWYFGNKVGLNFNNIPPTVSHDSKMDSSEGSASISDSIGNLLFYTQGDTVWNKEHKIMQNGMGLCGKYSHSSPSAAVIIKMPLSSNYFYIFSSDQRSLYIDEGVCYSLVNMQLDSGRGRVILKKQLMVKHSAEKIAAVLHYNKKDVWIAVKQNLSDTLFVFLLTEKGISNKVLKYNTYKDSGYTGQIKFSPNGKYLAMGVSIGFPKLSPCYLYEFDNKTGNILNERAIISYSLYGLEFSSNSRLIYLRGFSKPINKYLIYQLPIKQIKKYHKIDSSISFGTQLGLGAMQLAPDGKIYISNIDSFLGCINFPNRKDTFCGFQENAIKIYSKNGDSRIGLPSFLSSYYKKPDFEILQNCINKPANFIVEDSNEIDSVRWNFGDKTSGLNNFSFKNKISHKYSKYGTYEVKLIKYENGVSDTFTEHITFIDPQTNFNVWDVCENDTVRFINSTPNSNTNKFHWKFGDATSSDSLSPKHLYNISGISQTFNVTLISTSASGCKDSITKDVTINAKPNSEFRFTQKSNNVNFKAQTKGFPQYIWYMGNGDSIKGTDSLSYNYPYTNMVYTVCLKVIDASDCQSKSCKDVQVKSTGIINDKKQELIRIYPNPSNGNIIINYPKHENKLNISIINMIGQNVKEYEIEPSDSNKINLNLPRGIYYIKACNNKISIITKLIVQ